jgi:hypothetical protein
MENMADDVAGFSEEDRAAWRAYKAMFPGYIATGEVNLPHTTTQRYAVRTSHYTDDFCSFFLSIKYSTT